MKRLLMPVAHRILCAVLCLAVFATTWAESLSDLSATAKERAKDYTFDFERPTYDDMERVKALAKIGRDRGQQAFAQFAARHGDAMASQQDEKEPMDRVDGIVLVALSSSMPEETVRDYMAQLQGIPEATVVLRGFVGGAATVRETGVWIEKVRRKSPGCRDCGHYPVKSIVDPLLFRELGIQQVPAVTFIPGVKDISHCDGEDFSAAVVAYGVTPVGYALQEISRNGVEVPAALIKRLDGTGWEEKGE